MCGRYSLTTPVEALRQLFLFPELPNLAPRVNIAPTQMVPAVRLGSSDAPGGDAGPGAAAASRHLVMLRWGLVPFWAKDLAIGSRMINARGEQVAEKPAFRAAFKRRRCLILADGFYEWRKEAGGKQPYRIARADGAPFAFAGLWERWIDPASADEIESCTIITTTANSLLRAIHDRMPVILDPADHDAWLAPETAPARLQRLMRAHPVAALRAYPVSKRIGAVANDTLDLIEPVGPDLGAAAAAQRDDPARQSRLL